MSARRGSGRALALVAAGFVAVACMTGHDVLVDRQWSLVSVAGAPLAAPGGVAFGADGRFIIDTGCNSGGGTYHLDGNRILLDSETLTEMACEGPVGEQELLVLNVVEGRPTYAIDTGTGRLRLTGPGEAVLLFSAP